MRKHRREQELLSFATSHAPAACDGYVRYHLQILAGGYPAAGSLSLPYRQLENRRQELGRLPPQQSLLFEFPQPTARPPRKKHKKLPSTDTPQKMDRS